MLVAVATVIDHAVWYFSYVWSYAVPSLSFSSVWQQIRKVALQFIVSRDIVTDWRETDRNRSKLLDAGHQPGSERNGLLEHTVLSALHLFGSGRKKKGHRQLFKSNAMKEFVGLCDSDDGSFYSSLTADKSVRFSRRYIPTSANSLIRLATHPFHPSIHPSIHPPTHPSIHPFHQSILDPHFIKSFVRPIQFHYSISNTFNLLNLDIYICILSLHYVLIGLLIGAIF